MNYFEIYKSIYLKFILNLKENRDLTAYKRFLKELINEIFFYINETFKKRLKKSKNRYIYIF
jgi:hypothetical protein